MIQGFETRDNTDIPVRALVNSARGKLYKRNGPSVGQYEKTHWPEWEEDYNNPILVFGILRGTADLIKNAHAYEQDWYYFDHAYMFGNKHSPSKIFGERIYRLTKNWYHETGLRQLKKADYERIEKYKKHYELKPWKYDGDYILVCPPSEHITKYFKEPNWLENTLKTLKKHTRKEIKVRTKQDTNPLQEDIDGAYAVVSFQSAVCIDAIISGVPSFCGVVSMGNPVSEHDFSKIKEPIYSVDRQAWINTLLAGQFTMTEIENGTAWNYVNNT